MWCGLAGGSGANLDCAFIFSFACSRAHLLPANATCPLSQVRAHHKAQRKEAREKEERRKARRKGLDPKPTKQDLRKLKLREEARSAGGGSLFW